MKGLKLEAGGNVSLREAVYQTLRRAILTNLLKPGERLMELKLAAELGVSRTPVREAIHLLEKELLVKQEPHKGIVVAEITLKQLRDVLEVRSMLEELAVRLACRRGRETDLERLRAAAGDFASAVEAGEDAVIVAFGSLFFLDEVKGEIVNNMRGGGLR